MKKSEQIKGEIEALQEKMKTAQKKELEKKRNKILQAANKSGLISQEVPAELLEKEFRAMASRLNQDSDPFEVKGDSDFSNFDCSSDETISDNG